MKRRSLLGAMLAAAVAPAFIRNAMPVKAVGEGVILGIDYGTDDTSGIAIMDGNKLFMGEVGRYDGIKLLYDQEVVRRWSVALARQLGKTSMLCQLMTAAGPSEGRIER